jgi:hypothetical protein
MSARLAPAAKLLCVIQVVAAALLIAACGGSSSRRSATAQASQSAATEGAYAAAKADHDVVTNGVVTHRPLHGTGGGEINDDNPADTGGHPATAASDPCTLVSRAEAQAIVGRPIDPPVEARLGPTCIYQPAGAKNLITVTVESINAAAIKRYIRKRTQLNVSGRTAYCGTYGQPITLVPLAGGRALAVTAPCAIGIRFAAKALPRVKE